MKVRYSEDGDTVVPCAAHNSAICAEVNDLFVFDTRQDPEDVLDRETHYSLRLEDVANEFACQLGIAFYVFVCHFAAELVYFVSSEIERVHQYEVTVLDNAVVLFDYSENIAWKSPKLPIMSILVGVINTIKKRIAFKEASTYLLLFSSLPLIILVGIVTEEHDFGMMIQDRGGLHRAATAAIDSRTYFINELAGFVYPLFVVFL